MNVLIFHFDGKVPNFADMKIAAWHRAAGDHVELRIAKTPARVQPRLGDPKWDRVYGSLIFESTRPLADLARTIYPGIVLGGTGWDFVRGVQITNTVLPDDVEAMAPDYSDYRGFKVSTGYTHRGCRLECDFCVVPRKEGKVQPVATLAKIWRGDPWPRQILLLDNDFFGQVHPKESPPWRARLDEARAGKFSLSFIQGINARILTDEIAAELATVDVRDDGFKRRRIYTAWDGRRDERRLMRGLDALMGPGRFSADMILVYMLIGHEPGETHADRDYRRARLREMGVRPYPMPYTRDGDLGRELVAFQRWVIQRHDLHVPWAEWWGKALGEPRKLGARRVSLPLFPDGEDDGD
jgi:hypothetical protein